MDDDTATRLLLGLIEKYLDTDSRDKAVLLLSEQSCAPDVVKFILAEIVKNTTKLSAEDTLSYRNLAVEFI